MHFLKSQNEKQNKFLTVFLRILQSNQFNFRIKLTVYQI